jgi:hypothetical protein
MKWTLINFDENWERTIEPSQVRKSRGLSNPRFGVEYAYRVLIPVDVLPMDALNETDAYEFVVSDNGERPVEFVATDFRQVAASTSQEYAEFTALDVTSLELVMSASTAD